MGRHWHRRHTRRHLRRKRNKKVLWITFGVIITLIIISNWPAISNYLGDFKPIVSEGNNLIEKVTDPLTHDVDISLIELEINTLINEERTKEGLSILGLEDSVSDVARIHSQDMLDNNFFDHINLKGEDPTSRGIKSGVTCYKDYESYYTEGFAENLGGSPFGNVVDCGYVYSEKSLAKCMVDGWMESQGHRENILTPDYDETGIGVACDYSQCYGTQMFC